jgi:predicted  nucleic acid-binding Zn-ribbon protein
VAHLNLEAESDKTRARQALVGKDAEIGSLVQKVSSLEQCLDAARKAIVDALNASSKVRLNRQ